MLTRTEKRDHEGELPVTTDAPHYVNYYGRIKESRSFSLTDHRINNYLLIKALRPNICFSRIQSRARIICLFTCPHPRKIRSPDLRRLIPPRRARRRHRDEDKLRPCYLLPLALSRELYIWGGAFAGEGRKKKKKKKEKKRKNVWSRSARSAEINIVYLLQELRPGLKRT